MAGLSRPRWRVCPFDRLCKKVAAIIFGGLQRLIAVSLRTTEDSRSSLQRCRQRAQDRAIHQSPSIPAAQRLCS